MKRFFVVLLLICSFCAASVAQSGRRASRVEPQPTPSTSPDNSNSSDSIPINKQPRVLPSLHGGGEISTAPTQNQTQDQTSAASDKGETVGDDEVLRVDTQLVTIPVSIIDRQGNFVTGLEQSDFKIYEDGKEQQVAYFSTTEQPFTVILMLDVSPSTHFKIDEIHNAAVEFVRHLKENDRVMVVAFDQSTRVLTEPTTDRNAISKAIRRANFGEGTSIYDAVDYVIKRSLSKIEG
ncbi:MAG: VWA domain-containing protein, partial [Pyrinomonadaceae bacterium]